MTEMTKFSIYRDSDFTGTSYFVGKPEWQDCMSRVWAVGECDTYAQAVRFAAEMAALSDEDLEKRKRWYETPGRFEMACDAGMYGARW